MKLLSNLDAARIAPRRFAGATNTLCIRSRSATIDQHELEGTHRHAKNAAR